MLSRVLNKDKDKDLRFKAQALANVTPQDFGVDRYLLLNEQTPMVQLAESQNLDFERMTLQIGRRSTVNSKIDGSQASDVRRSQEDTSVEYIFEGKAASE